MPRHALAGPCNSEHACGWTGVRGTYPRVPIARQGLTFPPSTCTRRAIELPAAASILSLKTRQKQSIGSPFPPFGLGMARTKQTTGKSANSKAPTKALATEAQSSPAYRRFIGGQFSLAPEKTPEKRASPGTRDHGRATWPRLDPFLKEVSSPAHGVASSCARKSRRVDVNAGHVRTGCRAPYTQKRVPVKRACKAAPESRSFAGLQLNVKNKLQGGFVEEDTRNDGPGPATRLPAVRERYASIMARLHYGATPKAVHVAPTSPQFQAHGGQLAAAGATVGRAQEQQDKDPGIYAVCKGVCTDDTAMFHFDVLAITEDINDANNYARQSFCTLSKLEVHYREFFDANPVVGHSNTQPCGWKASSVFVSPEPQGLAESCCGLCGKVFAEGPEISPTLLPETINAAGMVYLRASCQRCHGCGASAHASSRPGGVACSPTALHVWVQRAPIVDPPDMTTGAFQAGPRKKEMYAVVSGERQELRASNPACFRSKTRLPIAAFCGSPRLVLAHMKEAALREARRAAMVHCDRGAGGSQEGRLHDAWSIPMPVFSLGDYGQSIVSSSPTGGPVGGYSWNYKLLSTSTWRGHDQDPVGFSLRHEGLELFQARIIKTTMEFSPCTHAVQPLEFTYLEDSHRGAVCPGINMWWGGGCVRSSSCDLIFCPCRKGLGRFCAGGVTEQSGVAVSRRRAASSGDRRPGPPPTPHDLFHSYLPYSSSSDELDAVEAQRDSSPPAHYAEETEQGQASMMGIQFNA